MLARTRTQQQHGHLFYVAKHKMRYKKPAMKSNSQKIGEIKINNGTAIVA